MKKSQVLCISFILIGSLMFGQSWVSSNRIYSDTDVSAIQTTTGSDGKTVLLGDFTGTLNIGSSHQLTSYGARDYFVVKFSELGSVEWARKLGGTANEYVQGGICACFDNNIYVTGGFRNNLFYTDVNSIPSAGAWDTFLAKYDADGNVLWCINVGAGALSQRPNTLKVDRAGNVLIGGFFTDSIYINETTTLYSDDGIDDYYYSKFDADGNLIWAKQIKSIENAISGRIYSIDATDDYYYLSGFFADSTVFTNDTIVSRNNSYDIHLIQTNLDGDVNWIRKIAGNGDDLTYGVVADDSDNIYLSGYFDSTDTLFVDENDLDTMFIIDQSKGDFDFLVAKYNTSGDLQWARTAGGKAADKLNDISLTGDSIIVSGYFSDTLMWGGIEVASTGQADVDMFVGQLDSDGNFRSANSYAGRNNSFESAKSVFYVGTTSYTIIRSNSDLLELGDSIYVSTGGVDYLVIGVVDCLPISIDNTVYTDISTCYGDSTGSIQVSATGGFGSPWQYSIDNGLIYSDQPFYADLPAGDYQVVVIDAENCAQTGQLVTLTQPDTLLPSVNLKDDILHHTDWLGDVEVTPGSLVITAAGGTSPYLYTLIPAEGVPGAPQALGTFSFALEDSGKYVVALNDFRDCGPSETDTVEINVIRTKTPDGIDGLDGVEVKMYPNPTSGLFTLEMLYDADEVPLEVINMTGQVVLQDKLYPNSGMISEVIDLSKVPKGIYMIRIDGRSLKSAVVVK